MWETKIDRYWVGTISYKIKRLFDLDIGEKFILKDRAFDRNCFINEEGIVIFEDFACTNVTLKYGTIDVDYKMLKILTTQCDCSIKKNAAND